MHHAMNLYLVEGFEWNFLEIFINLVGIAEKVFTSEIKGRGHDGTD